MPYTIGGGGRFGQKGNRGPSSKTLNTKSKSISYGTSDQIYSLTDTVAVDSPSVEIPRQVRVTNNGAVPLIIMAGYKSYSTETAIADSGATRYLHTMLMPGKTYFPSIRGVIDTATNTGQFDGTIATNAAPSDNMYIDSGADTTEGFADDNDTTITFDDGSGAVAHTMFKVNDLIRLDNEICRITSIVDTAGDGAYTPAHFIVDRAVHGSAKADHTNNTDIRFPFFNAYHDFDKYSVVQTNSNGAFKASNFFALGRTASGVSGIVPGSIAIKFYNAGFQTLGLSGISPSKSTGLTAGGSYWFKIAIDGGTAEAINFTVDTTNTNWGGVNGVINKIQSALDSKYNNTASNTFQQASRCGIVDGDIRFTSGQRLATSAIALTAGTDGASASYNIFAQQNGWFPALANISTAVAARLPDDVIYDEVTYSTSPTNVFSWDDGLGRLQGMCKGKINYETGQISMSACPPNAQFVYSVSYNSVFAGKVGTASTTLGGTLVDILANCPSQKRNGSVTVSSD